MRTLLLATSCSLVFLGISLVVASLDDLITVASMLPIVTAGILTAARLRPDGRGIGDVDPQTMVRVARFFNALALPPPVIVLASGPTGWLFVMALVLALSATINLLFLPRAVAAPASGCH